MNLKYYLALVMILVMSQMPAKADDNLTKHLEGKELVYVGVCYVKKDGVLTFSNEEKVAVIDCAVGMVKGDQTKHYVLFYYNKKPAKLVMYDETTKTQVTLWIGQSV